LVKDYRGDTTLAVGEAFDPSPATIEARTTRITLPSGFKLALLPKKTRGHAVFVTLNLRYGSEHALMNRGSAAVLVAGMLLRGKSCPIGSNNDQNHPRRLSPRSAGT